MGNTRERILERTEELFRRQGFNATGLKQIVTEAEAPFGSIYHFFPGGKQELGAAVIRAAGTSYQKLVMGVLEAAPDPVTAVLDCFRGAAAVLEQTNYADACPIETVALEVASTNETLRLACAEVFGAWIDAGAHRLETSGVPAPSAHELAILFVASLEGAFILARTLRSTEPMMVVGRATAAAVGAALTRGA